MPDCPAESQVLAYFDELSNWGRWGADDSLGTLNLITDKVRKRAASCVKAGKSVSCAWDIEFNGPSAHGVGPVRFMVAHGQGLSEVERAKDELSAMGGRSHAAAEFFGMTYHGLEHTHLDAPSHFFWDAQMYNGRAAREITTERGATVHPVTKVADGILTRGVLLDIAALRGVDWLEVGEGIFPEDLEAAENAQGVRVESGDALLVRTGQGRRKREDQMPMGQPGLQAAALPWLRERGVSLLASDVATDALPSGYAEVGAPVHAVAMVAMGMWLIDNCDLEGLRELCSSFSRWECQLSVAPLRLVGGTGSPVNPIATL